jgi:hypothetical protein
MSFEMTAQKIPPPLGSSVVAAGLTLAVGLGCDQLDELGTDAPAAPATGSRTGPDAAARDGYHRIGEQAQADDYAMVVRAVSRCKVAPHHQPPVGHEKLGVEVEIRGSTTREVPVNPFYAELVDDQQVTRYISFGGCQPELPSVRIRKGDVAQGWISYEVPSNAHGLKLHYRPYVVGTGRQTLHFDLGR